MFDKLAELPVWTRWVAGIVLITSVDAIRMAWGERHFVGAFSESFVAVLLYWATLLGSFALAIWAGSKVGGRTSRAWLGWFVGIVVLFSAFEVRDVVKEIPGVGWRIKMMEQAHDDYDY
jgi:hypothetical protein